MHVEGIDHLVLTVRDVTVTAEFYTQVLGMRTERFGDGRYALRCGRQKINLHPADNPFEPKALRPTPGSADICLIASGTVEATLLHLRAMGIQVEAGPLPRTGALGPTTSVYLRDPDHNLVEIAHY